VSCNAPKKTQGDNMEYAFSGRANRGCLVKRGPKIAGGERQSIFALGQEKRKKRPARIAETARERIINRSSGVTRKKNIKRKNKQEKYRKILRAKKWGGYR